MLYNFFIKFKCSFLASRKCSLQRFGGVKQFFFLNMYVSIDISIYDFYRLIYFPTYSRSDRFLQIARLCSVSFCTLHVLFHIFNIKCMFKVYWFLKIIAHLLFSLSHKSVQPVISRLEFFFIFIL